MNKFPVGVGTPGVSQDSVINHRGRSGVKSSVIATDRSVALERDTDSTVKEHETSRLGSCRPGKVASRDRNYVAISRPGVERIDTGYCPIGNEDRHLR